MTICPRCQLEFEVRSGVESGGIDLDLKEEIRTEDLDPYSAFLGKPRARVRGKAREYSDAFETAWRLYGRKEEKLRAFGEWIVQARLAGGEPLLLPQILSSLRWQGPAWAADGWRFAPYFERYLKRRKWEDERPPAPVEQRASAAREQTRQALERDVRATDRKIAAMRAAQAKASPPPPRDKTIAIEVDGKPVDVAAVVAGLADAKGAG